MTSPQDNHQVNEPASQSTDPLLNDMVGRAKVMMIDDEPILIELVRAFLDDAGYQFFVGVSEPEKAIDTLTEQSPDVLLLDLMMPKVSGFDVLEKVRSDAELRHLPVIVMTSASDADTKLRVLELGATDFLEKPVDPSELVLRLRNTLAFKAHRDRTVYFDPLTNLPNRRLFMSQLASSLRRCSKNRVNCGLIHFDFDRLKQINQTLGHRIGDAMVRAMAQRVQASLAGVDPMGTTSDGSSVWTLSRLGGAEFAALMPGIERPEQAAAVARNLASAMARPILIDDHELVAAAFVGIAISPADGESP
jgi:diguanylate cyclase (GGDEF)-like protein